ncbi:MBL fold metallo-hydrolase [Flavobacterium agrisoli]|uniref:MBL fold metallo-hydrolase n=1 Tax=Flavobacterium agrisoli TaxID=2793066 RepID=A0A934UJD4_9FLAO|nr:MBL fold metallo-hydrolase [Flavobacterium agrisoli]MBK0369841.1 MBL fold metallo-hydrolase [Flavobacterium agrisoli]
MNLIKDDWFTVEKVDNETYVISEYKHWEETHCYLLNGTTNSLLIDTGLGVKNIKAVVNKFATKPLIVIPTHTHYDHIGGLRYFDNFYIHENEEDWINGNFPLPLDFIKNLLIEEPCEFPLDFNIDDYEIFQGKPTKILKDNDIIELGNRTIQIIHTPGHAPGHICLYEKEKEYLYSGDLIYKGKLTAFFPTSDPKTYKNSIDKVVNLPIKKILPSHFDLDLQTSIIKEIKDAFEQIENDGKLEQGSGLFHYQNFTISI